MSRMTVITLLWLYATLARAERLRDATKMLSGQVLVTLGAVTEEQLAVALREKTEEILCELLTWDQGTFEFEGGDRPEATMVPISMEVTKLLLESMHRLDQQRGGQPLPEPEPVAPAPVAAATKEFIELLGAKVHPSYRANKKMKGYLLDDGREVAVELTTTKTVNVWINHSCLTSKMKTI